MHLVSKSPVLAQFLLLAACFLAQSADAGDTSISCRVTLPQPASGICSYQPGNSLLLIQADVLTPDNILVNGDLLIDADGRIACAGCDCSDTPGADGAALLICPDTTLSPGLIDSYNDLRWSENTPADHGDERYEHRHEWRLGINGHTQISVTPNSESEVWGEFRAIISGVTSTAGTGGVDNLARNLADRHRLDGITSPAWDRDTFPLSDANGVTMTQGCNYPGIPFTLDPAFPYMPVIAEGIDDRAQNEFTCLSDNNALGVDVIPGATIRHGISLDMASVTEMLFKASHLVWTPRSDISIYGITAPIPSLHNASVNLLLGSRWQLTGSLNLFRELECAADYNNTYLDNLLSDQELFAMVTGNPAKAAGMQADIGYLQAGNLADVSLFNSEIRQGYSAVTQADESDVLLVLKEGVPLYGDALLMETLGAADPDCELIAVCGQARRICAQRETGAAFPTNFTTPLAACGIPITNERSCLPARTEGLAPLFDGIPSAADQDGDGVSDATDNCPVIFNPPLSRGDMQQDDADGDGIGDVCDSEPNRNNDIVFDDEFESPIIISGTVSGLARPGLVIQLNGTEMLSIDADGPFAFDTELNFDEMFFVRVAASPVNQSCAISNNAGVIGSEDINVEVNCIGGPATIYSVKRGEITGTVDIDDVLVTACVDGLGFFAQTVMGDINFEGIDNSGIFAFQPLVQCDVSVTVGDRVDILSGDVDDVFGQIQLRDVNFQTISSGNTLPEPVIVNATSIADTVPGVLDSVLVQVQDVTVTTGTNFDGAFEVDDSLFIGDFIHSIDPPPSVGTVYSSVTGILHFSFGNTELEPRSTADLVVDVPQAATVYMVKQGQTSGMVSVSNLLVTACAENRGFFAQTISDDPDFAGVDNSAVFTFIPGTQCGNSISQGDRVTIVRATPVNFFGQVQLQSVSFQVNSSGNALPAPLLVDTTEVAGTTPGGLDAVLIQVQNVIVTSEDNGFGEFTVNNTLLITSFIQPVEQTPPVGRVFSSLTGVLHFSLGNTKLAPRSADDVVIDVR